MATLSTSTPGSTDQEPLLCASKELLAKAQSLYLESVKTWDPSPNWDKLYWMAQEIWIECAKKAPVPLKLKP
jgi:hypothetical protein